MLILGIDSSGSACTGALSEDGKVIGDFRIVSKKSHSEMLLPSIAKLLSDTGKTLDDVDRIAVSCGPGSYTGLRIGISTVKGLAVTRKIKCIPLSSLEVLAYGVNLPENTVISAMIDARREEFYQAFFIVKNGVPERLCEDRSVLFAELFEDTSKYENVFLIGDGAEKYIRLSGKDYAHLSGDDVFSSGVFVCKAAEMSENECEVEKLSPRYLKLSQAEREYQNKSEVKK